MKDSKSKFRCKLCLISLFIILKIIGLFFVTASITGNVVLNDSLNNQSFLGLVLFILGLIGNIALICLTKNDRQI